MPLFHAPILAIGLAMAGAPSAAAETALSADAAAVMEVNRAILDAVAKSDSERFRQLTTDEVRVLAPGGRLEDKDMVIEGLGTVKGQLAHSGENVIVVGDTAILTGKMEGEAVMEPFGKLPPMKYIATFVRTDEGWRMLSRAMTPCAPVAIQHGVC